MSNIPPTGPTVSQNTENVEVGTSRFSKIKLSIQKPLQQLAQKIHKVVVKDFCMFFVPLTFTRLRVSLPGSAWKYFDKLDGLSKDHKLFLGAIPLENNFEGIKTSMGGEPGKKPAFLSVVEPHETVRGVIYKPALHHKGAATRSDVTNKHLGAKDFGGVSPENIGEGVKFIKEQLDAGNPVYVHCKAGRARSATVVIAYLIEYEWESIANHIKQKVGNPDYTFKEDDTIKCAIDYLKAQRTQVDIGKENEDAIKQYLQSRKTTIVGEQ